MFLVVVLVFGSNWAVMKGALNLVTPVNVALDRLALSALLLSPLLFLVRGRMPRDKRTLLKLLVLGTVNALSIVSTYTGLVHTGSGIAAILTYTQPLFVFCFSALFLRSEAKVSTFIGAFIGFFGVVVLSIGKSSTLGGFAHSEFLLLMGALLWAITIVYYKKALSHVDPVLTNALQQAVGVIVLAPVASNLEGFRFSFATQYVLMIMYSAVFATCVGATLWLNLVREEDVTVLSSSSYLIPMVAVSLGWLLLGEDIELGSILGMGLILAGVYLVNRSRSA